MTTPTKPVDAETVPQFGPPVPADVMACIQAYGDARADDNGLSGLRLCETIIALRRWAATPPAPAAVPAEPVGVLIRGEGGAWHFSCGDCLLALYAMPQGEHLLYATPPPEPTPAPTAAVEVEQVSKEIDALILQFGNASFDCGDHRGSTKTYREMRAKAAEAERLLRAAVAAALSQPALQPAGGKP